MPTNNDAIQCRSNQWDRNKVYSITMRTSKVKKTGTGLKWPEKQNSNRSTDSGNSEIKSRSETSPFQLPKLRLSPNSTNGFTYRSTNFWQLVSADLLFHTINNLIHISYANFMTTCLTQRTAVLIDTTEKHTKLSVKFLPNFDIKAKPYAILNQSVRLPTPLHKI